MLIAPRYRVMSVGPRGGTPYQVGATDLLGVILQFGLHDPVVLGEGLGCVTTLVFSAWYPEHARRLILAKPTWNVSGDSLEARALRDCPPDLPALSGRIRCPVTEVSTAEQVAATLP